MPQEDFKPEDFTMLVDAFRKLKQWRDERAKREQEIELRTGTYSATPTDLN